MPAVKGTTVSGNASVGSAPPVVESITASELLIDRDVDYLESGAVDETVITVRVHDNNGYETLDPLRLSVRDSGDSVVVDNVEVTDTSVVDSLTLDFTYTFNAPDSLSDGSLGKFDVRAEGWDGSGKVDVEDFTEMGFELVEVQDRKTTVSGPEEISQRDEITLSGRAYGVAGTVSLDNVTVYDPDEGVIQASFEKGGDEWNASYTVTSPEGSKETATVRLLDEGSRIDGRGTLTYWVGSRPETVIPPPTETPDIHFEVRVGSSTTGLQEVSATALPKIPMGDNVVFIVLVRDGAGNPVDEASATVSIYDTLDKTWRSAWQSRVGRGEWRAEFPTKELENPGTYRYTVAVSSSFYDSPDSPLKATFEVTERVPKGLWQRLTEGMKWLSLEGMVAFIAISVLILSVVGGVVRRA